MIDWLLDSPWPRTFIPLAGGVLGGFLTNTLAVEITVTNSIVWRRIPHTVSFWGIAVIAIAVGIYQVCVFRRDQRAAQKNERDEIFSEVGRRSVDALSEHYTQMIQNGEIDQLQKEDKKLKSIFGRLP